MTISDRLYNKYKNKQVACFKKYTELDNEYNENIALLKTYKMREDQEYLLDKLDELKKDIAFHISASEVLRAFLHEIALENKEVANDI